MPRLEGATTPWHCACFCRSRGPAVEHSSQVDPASAREPCPSFVWRGIATRRNRALLACSDSPQAYERKRALRFLLVSGEDRVQLDNPAPQAFAFLAGQPLAPHAE